MGPEGPLCSKGHAGICSLCLLSLPCPPKILISGLSEKERGKQPMNIELKATQQPDLKAAEGHPDEVHRPVGAGQC